MRFLRIMACMTSTAILTVSDPRIQVILHGDGSVALVTPDCSWRTFPVAIQDRGEVEEDTVWLRHQRPLMDTWPARFAAVAEGDGARLTVLDRMGQSCGDFHVRLAVEAGAVEVVISDIAERLPSLCWPPPFISTHSLVPHAYGTELASTTTDNSIFKRSIAYPYAGWNVFCCGSLDGDHGVLLTFGDRVYDAMLMVVNEAPAALWTRSLGRWLDTYRLSFHPTRDGYVGMAKAYRRVLEQRGRIRTLAEKLAEQPALARLRGGRVLSYFQAWPAAHQRTYEDAVFHPLVRAGMQACYTTDFTHAQVTASLAHARRQGFTNGLVLLRGWGTNGYDGRHPDVLPPDPRLGSEAEFRALLAGDDRTLVCLHDQYQDTFEHSPSFPQGVIRDRQGRFITGGVWAGGQAYICDSRFSLRRAEENWRQLLALGARAIHLDTVGASRLIQSFDPASPETKTQDAEGKEALMAWFRSQGVLIGTEDGSDTALAAGSWFETRAARDPERRIVPFWQLAFHDCAYTSRLNAFRPGITHPGWLEDLPWGGLIQVTMDPRFGDIGGAPCQQVGFGANPCDERDWHASFAVDRLHARIGDAAMTDHRFLTAEGDVERVVWHDGLAVTVNFSAEPRTIDGVTIPGHDWIASEPLPCPTP